MRRKLLLVCAGLLLAACATPEERAARAQREMDDMIRVYGPACDKLGYKQGDDKWRDCILNLAWKDQYNQPRSTTCFGHHGFLDCTTF